jgi:hypothetical protein
VVPRQSPDGKPYRTPGSFSGDPMPPAPPGRPWSGIFSE